MKRDLQGEKQNIASRLYEFVVCTLCGSPIDLLVDENGDPLKNSRDIKEGDVVCVECGHRHRVPLTFKDGRFRLKKS